MKKNDVCNLASFIQYCSEHRWHRQKRHDTNPTPRWPRHLLPSAIVCALLSVSISLKVFSPVPDCIVDSLDALIQAFFSLSHGALSIRGPEWMKNSLLHALL